MLIALLPGILGILAALAAGFWFVAQRLREASLVHLRQMAETYREIDVGPPPTPDRTTITVYGIGTRWLVPLPEPATTVVQVRPRLAVTPEYCGHCGEELSICLYVSSGRSRRRCGACGATWWKLLNGGGWREGGGERGDQR